MNSVFAGESKAFTLRLSIGCLMALVGFAFYSYSKVSQQQWQQLQRKSSVPGRPPKSRESPVKPTDGFDEEAQEQQSLLRPDPAGK